MSNHFLENNQLNSEDFKYYLTPGSHPHPSYFDEYMKIYNVWEEVWVDAFKELGVTKKFHSDSFTRQDYVGALFHKGECFALAFYRWAHAGFSNFENDSYFYNWKGPHLDELRSRGDRIIVCSYFTVHPRGRGTRLGLSGKDLLMGMITKTFMNSDADAMTGAVRINKGVNNAGLKWGASLIDSNIDSGYDADVDLIGFFKDVIAKHPANELSALTQKLWSATTVIPRMDLSRQFNPEFQSLQSVA